MSHKRHLQIQLLTLISFFLFLASCLTAYNVHSLSGVITDEDSGEPIDNVIINLRWESDSSGVGLREDFDTTAADGYFQFDTLPPNTFQLRAFRSGYDTIERNISFSRGIRLNFEMSKTENEQ